MGWLIQIAGAALIVVVLRDVFHMVFHPSGTGGPSIWIFRSVWWLAANLGRPSRSMAGPAAMLLVIASWVGALIVGWALIYTPDLPELFILDSALDPAGQGGFDEALYLSAVAQSTLGLGDIAPREGLARAFVPLQATIGFAIYTGAITWVLSVYPALHRQRATASMIRIFDDAGGVPGDDVTSALRLDKLAEGLSNCRVDLVQYPASFYFRPRSSAVSLAEELPVALALARGGGEDPSPSRAELAAAIDAFATTLAEEFSTIEGADTDQVIRSYRRHHGLTG